MFVYSDSIFNTISKNELLDIINTSYSISDLLRYFNKNPQGRSRQTFLKRCSKDNIDITCLKYITPSRKKYTNKQVFVENSNFSRKSIKKRILKENLLEHRCIICNQLPEWNNKKLVLILDHINGIYNDHRLENLRFLCPNCNSQTTTFAGRNIKRKKIFNSCCDCGKDTKNIRCYKCSNILKKLETPNKKLKKWTKKRSIDELNEYMISRRKVRNRPSKELLLSQINEFGYAGTGRFYDVSSSSIKRWLKQYNKESLNINS